MERISRSTRTRKPDPDTQPPSATFHTVSAEFFDTLKVPMLQGRPFDSRDSSTAPWVVIVNESMARKYWPDSSPIGRYLTFMMPGEEQPRQVIGIARDMRYGRLNEESNVEMFVPHTQIPALTGHFHFYVRKTIILRTTVDPMTLVPAARKITAQVAGNRPITDIKTVDQHLDRQFQWPRFSLLLLGIFGGTAVILAAVGIYGVMAYLVKMRTHEIGVRMALGARRKDVMWMILRHGLTLTFIGVAAGTGGALVAYSLYRRYALRHPADRSRHILYRGPHDDRRRRAGLPHPRPARHQRRSRHRPAARLAS